MDRRDCRPVERRSTVASGGFGRAEILSVTGLTRSRTPVVHSPRFQVLFPLAGVFRWHVGSRAPLVDPNQVLFIAAGDESRDSHPSVGDAEALLLTPEPDLLESAWRSEPAALRTVRAFSERVLPSAPAIQRLAAAIAWCGRSAPAHARDELEEAIVELLCATARHSGTPRREYRRNGGRLVGLIKEAVGAAEGRVTLHELSRQLGRSAAWLTEVFRRSEGMPIARYQRRLRLVRALSELPHTDDITALALRFGFSSHAHFSSAFRAEFGCTPSEYRARARRRDLPALLAQRRTT
ncbi:MAG TPA: helix-turn-helix transcriptional regulator [Woeseiaceae bacterium]|nr:helix-turn-helix transcriptional regulator [Woeseiaceae bacterium]